MVGAKIQKSLKEQVFLKKKVQFANKKTIYIQLLYKLKCNHLKIYIC